MTLVCVEEPTAAFVIPRHTGFCHSKMHHSFVIVWSTFF